MRHRVAATILFLMVFPWLVPYHALAINILIWGLFALGFNLLYGYAGLLSFGHAALLGVGSYGCGIVIVHFGWPWYVAILCGIAFASAVAYVIGFLAIRTRGIYFSMVTLALAECVYYIFYKWESVTGGENGLRGINVSTINLLGFEVNFLDPVNRDYVMLGVVAIALWVFSRILASPFGAVLETIRENDARAAACGYNVANTKLDGVRAVGRVLRRGRRVARAAPVDRAGRSAADLDFGRRRDDGAARWLRHFLRAIHRRCGLPAVRRRAHAVDHALAVVPRGDVHRVRAVFSARHLGFLLHWLPMQDGTPDSAREEQDEYDERRPEI